MGRKKMLKTKKTGLFAASLAALVVMVGWVGRVHAQAAPATDRWYAVMVEGHKAGWMRLAVEPTKDGRITTVTQMQMSLRRGPVALPITIRSTFEETANGRPIEASVVQSFGQMQTTQRLRFGNETMQFTTQQAGMEQTQQLPLPRVNAPGAKAAGALGWLTPAGIQRYVEQRLAAGDKEISYWMVDPALGPEPTEVVVRVVGRENVEVLGKVVPAIACDTSVSKMPGITTRSYLDDHGREVRMTMAAIPGMTMTVVLADRQLATSPNDPPEIMATTFIKPDKPITSPRQLESAVYELTIENDLRSGDPVKAFEPPDTLLQRVNRLNGHAVRVAVDLSKPPPDYQDPRPDDTHLHATMALNKDDPEIQALARRALSRAAATTPAAKAEALRRFVYEYIDAKDLSVGFATASEVARTAQGDCTEHAVLLAALLRVVGIPSRTVNGVIYIDEFLNQAGVFGYHMWTQAWLEGGPGRGGRWVDLDATLQDQPFDAAHIAFATSAMDDPTMINDMISMLPLIGRLKIKVVDATSDPVAPTTDGR